jgi:hypothetical protein
MDQKVTITPHTWLYDELLGRPEYFPWEEAMRQYEAHLDLHCAWVRHVGYLMTDYVNRAGDKVYNCPTRILPLEIAADLKRRLLVHDASSYGVHEFRTKSHHHTLMKCIGYVDDHVEQAYRDAISHHLTHNRHHPEWHFMHEDMSPTDRAEMVCDWVARSLQYENDLDKALAHAKKVFAYRFRFTEASQDAILEKMRFAYALHDHYVGEYHLYNIFIQAGGPRPNEAIFASYRHVLALQKEIAKMPSIMPIATDEQIAAVKAWGEANAE